jgi:hypothetical protein
VAAAVVAAEADEEELEEAEEDGDNPQEVQVEMLGSYPMQFGGSCHRKSEIRQWPLDSRKPKETSHKYRQHHHRMLNQHQHPMQMQERLLAVNLILQR